LPEKDRSVDRRNFIRIKQNQTLAEASNLPVLVTLNRRSLYNKLEQFYTLIEQIEAGMCFISETWDRSHRKKAVMLSDCIEIEGYRSEMVFIEIEEEENQPC